MWYYPLGAGIDFRRSNMTPTDEWGRMFKMLKYLIKDAHET